MWSVILNSLTQEQAEIFAEWFWEEGLEATWEYFEARGIEFIQPYSKENTERNVDERKITIKSNGLPPFNEQ